jgi:hypothetical protein
MRDMMEKYMNGLQRYLSLTGMTAKSLAPQVVDPTPQIDTQIEAICIRIGIPKRIFTGSERGDLASTQDDSSWIDQLRARQNNYVTPRIIVPFVDRLIMVGVLPQPEGYSVVWPDLDALTNAEQAAIAVQRTEAMAKYIGGNVEALMVPMDYLTRVMEMDEEEVEAILKAAEEATAEREEEEAAAQEEQMKQMQDMGQPPMPGQFSPKPGQFSPKGPPQKGPPFPKKPKKQKPNLATANEDVDDGD